MRLKTLFPGGACKGTTKKGLPCGIRDIFENGYCKHHGGQGRLIRVIRATEKLQKKIERHKRGRQRRDNKLRRLLKDNPSALELFERLKARHGGTTQNEKRKDLRSEESERLALPVQAAPEGKPL